MSSCVSASVFVFLCAWLCVFVCLNLWFCVGFYISPTVSVWLCVCLHVYVSVFVFFVCLTLCVFVPDFVFLYLCFVSFASEKTFFLAGYSPYNKKFSIYVPYWNESKHGFTFPSLVALLLLRIKKIMTLFEPNAKSVFFFFVCVFYLLVKKCMGSRYVFLIITVVSNEAFAA